MGSVSAEDSNVADGAAFYDVIIIGGGFSGLYQLYHLRRAGLRVHLYEAGNGLGGVWYWNNYPGARVDTEVPCYQFLSPELYEGWTWSERFPGRDEIVAYFEHVEKKWNLLPDVSYGSRVTALKWDDAVSEWQATIQQQASPGSSTAPTASTARASFVVLCTGFASAPYTPPIPGLDQFQGKIVHPSHWPKASEGQQPLDLAGKRVGILGTGATGIQIIQEVAPVAAHLTVFQRTPSVALPMVQWKLDDAKNEKLKKGYAAALEKMRASFGGFLFEFSKDDYKTKTDAERRAFFDELYRTGGLQYWLGTYRDVLYDDVANATAYKYWRDTVLKRVHDPAVAELLAPATPTQPFGTKRISLEQNFYELFNQDNMELVDLHSYDISSATATGVQTSAKSESTTKPGQDHPLDVLILATGFDAISGGITQIDIVGAAQPSADGKKVSIKDKWQKGIDSYLGMATNGFPNLFYIFGPQAPTAFSTGPIAAEAQGEWIVKCITHMKENNLKSIDAEVAAEKEWSEQCEALGQDGLFSRAKSWYFGDNIPGKKRQCLNYMGGMPLYKEKIWSCARDGYAGFKLK